MGENSHWNTHPFSWCKYFPKCWFQCHRRQLEGDEACHPTHNHVAPSWLHPKPDRDSKDWIADSLHWWRQDPPILFFTKPFFIVITIKLQWFGITSLNNHLEWSYFLSQVKSGAKWFNNQVYQRLIAKNKNWERLKWPPPEKILLYLRGDQDTWELTLYVSTGLRPDTVFVAFLY